VKVSSVGGAEVQGTEQRGRWRLIVDAPGSAPLNMAKDEAILRGLENGQGLPTLRLYEWRRPAISVGRYQAADTLNRGAQESGVQVVRRITGGRAVLHNMELTYSVVCDARHELFTYGIRGAYRAISRCIVGALKDIGVGAELSLVGSAGAGGKRDSCFHVPARFEVTAGGRKIVGSSQRRFKRALLQHGSILFGMDKALTDAVFGKGASSRMSWVSEFTESSMEELKRALPLRVAEGLGVTLEEIEPPCGEETLIKSLEHSRYSNSAWNISGTDEVIEDGLKASGI